jgi:nucleotide-binding universal stress UspA family protein
MALQTIAVGIDGSAPATTALAWGAGLAGSTDASLQVLHVWQTPFICTHPWSAPSTEEATQHARSVVRSTISAAGVTGHVESVVLRGAFGPSLTAASATADLLVVGRTGQGLVEHKPEFGEVMAGSTARYCANHAASPVAAINEGALWVDAPEVVIGIDGSPASLEALRWATQELPANTSLHAVHAVSIPDLGLGAPIDSELLDPVVATHHNELRRLVDANVASSFAASGRSVRTHVVLGYAQDALTEPGFVCDLIVVGEHGETAAAAGVLGSVADHTLRYATVPIIIVPSPNQPTVDPDA